MLSYGVTRPQWVKVTATSPRGQWLKPDRHQTITETNADLSTTDKTAENIIQCKYLSFKKRPMMLGSWTFFLLTYFVEYDLTLNWIIFLFWNVILFAGVVHCKCYIFVWNWSNTVQCRYNSANFLTNIHKRFSLPFRVRYGVSFVDPASDWHSASVPVIIYVISYNIGQRYYGTPLYIQYLFSTVDTNALVL